MPERELLEDRPVAASHKPRREDANRAELIFRASNSVLLRSNRVQAYSPARRLSNVDTHNPMRWVSGQFWNPDFGKRTFGPEGVRSFRHLLRKPCRKHRRSILLRPRSFLIRFFLSRRWPIPISTNHPIQKILQLCLVPYQWQGVTEEMVESLRTNLEIIIPHITVGRTLRQPVCLRKKVPWSYFRHKSLSIAWIDPILGPDQVISDSYDPPFGACLRSTKPSGSLIEVKGRIRGLLQLDSGRMLALCLYCDNSTRFVMLWRREMRHCREMRDGSGLWRSVQ